MAKINLNDPQVDHDALPSALVTAASNEVEARARNLNLIAAEARAVARDNEVHVDTRFNNTGNGTDHNRNGKLDLYELMPLLVPHTHLDIEDAYALLEYDRGTLFKFLEEDETYNV